MLPTVLRLPLVFALSAGLVAVPAVSLLPEAFDLFVPALLSAIERPLAEIPVVSIPMEWRQSNWVARSDGRMQGSCVHASLVMLMRWQGQHELANWWRDHHGGGESWNSLEPQLHAAGITFAGTTDGDESFLEWSVRTRRGCAITVQQGLHMVCLVHLDQKWAGILDNNSPQKVQYFPRDQFIRGWQSSPAPWAITPVFSPPPPSPWQ